MTKNQIAAAKKKIATTLKKNVHPDNPLALEMNKRYRELEKLEEL